MADILWCQSNGVIAVSPAPGERLDKIVRRFLFPNDPLQVWIFRDLWVSDHTIGDKVREFFSLRGVLSGSFADGKAFLLMCQELGLVVKYDTSLTVPCSNGFRLRVMLENLVDPDRRGFSYDWREFLRSEYETLRWDNPPTRDELVKLLAEAADAPAPPPV